MNAAAAGAAGTPPVAIGGVGGSGTRLVAAIVRELGFHLGGDLNAANDTLWFTLLFKRREVLGCSEAEFDLLWDALASALAGGRPASAGVRAMVCGLASRDRPQHPASWLRQRCDTLLAATCAPARGVPWGWKEPNTHVVIERLWQRSPELRYIHVVRHGLDMAYSANQNQLALWGPHVLGSDGPATPARSLAYWCAVHRRMQEMLARNPQRMLWLDFDALCRQPDAAVGAIRAFLGVGGKVSAGTLASIRQPAGRHGRVPAGEFDSGDLAYVRELGYMLA